MINNYLLAKQIQQRQFDNTDVNALYPDAYSRVAGLLVCIPELVEHKEYGGAVGAKYYPRRAKLTSAQPPATVPLV